MNYEWIDAVEDAARHYGRAIQDPIGLSRAMKKLAGTQFERIQSAGQ